MNKFKIIMTGGGSAGHVTPNLALIPKLKQLGFEVQYIGSENGIEKEIVKSENIKYHSISSGKLRRYFDIKNITDPFKVLKGVFQARKIIKREKPNIVFSKGGFVSVPVVIGAYLNKVPVIAHESDITPGLANKLSTPFCNKICATFPETLNNMDKSKAVLTGTPIREELFKGNKKEGLKLCNFNDNKPVLMIMGGSLGSAIINNVIRQNIVKLTKQYNIIHICGKGNLDNNLNSIQGYRQFEYVREELTHYMAASDFIISRAGANAIFEFLSLKKPTILIPLSAKSSRGDQILNAKSFQKNGYSLVIQEEELNWESLNKNLQELNNNKNKYIKAMENSNMSNGVSNIISLIKEYMIK